ncbi:hypothetical protein FKW77_008482 [Venturia effusa]|uniref:Uncharacterized protein n=1 Tax=Venturia effusa TaxID=50376 RepID=A0A517LCQ3_9PEZI|nr:hypothetical protein FKW77_008482 [Venturia effusa]
MRLTTYLTSIVLTATVLLSNGAIAADNVVGALCSDCELQYWDCWDPCNKAGANPAECETQCRNMVCQNHPECRKEPCNYTDCLTNSSSEGSEIPKADPGNGRRDVDVLCGDCDNWLWDCIEPCLKDDVFLWVCKMFCRGDVCAQHPECRPSPCSIDDCVHSSSSRIIAAAVKTSVANHTVKATATMYSSHLNTSSMTPEVPEATAASKEMSGRRMIAPPLNPCLECTYLFNICKRRCEEEGSSPDYCGPYCRNDVCAAYSICRNQCGFEECTRSKRDVEPVVAITNPASMVASTFKTEVSPFTVGNVESEVTAASNNVVGPSSNPCVECTVLSNLCNNRCRDAGLAPAYCDDYCKNYICTEYKVCRENCEYRQCVHSKRDLPIAAAKEALKSVESDNAAGVPIIKPRAAANEVVGPINPCIDCQYLFNSCNNRCKNEEHLDPAYCEGYCQHYTCSEYRLCRDECGFRACLSSKRDATVTAQVEALKSITAIPG